MSGQYVEPWYVEMQNAAEAQSPAAIAAKAAADQVYQAQQAAANTTSQSQSGWFNTDSSPFGRGPTPRKGGRKSRKSRTRRYRK